jgi:hypothetical protein
VTRDPPAIGKPNLRTRVSPARGLRAAKLRLAVHPRFQLRGAPDVYLRGAVEALQAAGLVDARAARDWLSEAPGEDPVADGGLLPIRHAIYFTQPKSVGVRLLAVFSSERSVTIRWAQLPKLYGPRWPNAWVLPKGSLPAVLAADPRDSPFVAVSQHAGAAGMWDPPFWQGQTTLLTDTSPTLDGLEVSIGETAARISHTRQ